MNSTVVICEHDANDICADNPVAQKLLVKQLERYDLTVVATSNGEEALSGEYPGV